MAIHTELPVYRLANDLLGIAVDLTRNFPRNIRQLGQRINDECITMLVLIARANAARNKLPALNDLLESQQVVEMLLRLSLDRRYISPRQYARAADVCDRVGKQAGGWRRSQSAPAV